MNKLAALALLSAWSLGGFGRTAGAEPAMPLTAADATAWLDGYMPYALHSGDVAGAVVVIVQDGAPLVERGYGYADVAQRLPVDPQSTLFRWGSTSKLFTWTAVMQLVEQGRIDLDADVNQYLDFAIPARDGKPVTMRNLMTHTAGFEERLTGLIGVAADGVAPLDVFLQRYIPARIFPAGETPAYSNYATALAGHIVARVSGESFDDYVERHLFAPLQMTHSTFRQPLPPGFEAHLSQGYSAASMPPKPFEIVGPAPAGSLTSTGADMAHFVIAHLQDGAYGSARILQAATAEQMHTTALTILPAGDRMLLGFYEDDDNGHRVIAHGGDTQWFHSDLHLFLDARVGLLISMNSAGHEGAAQGIRRDLFKEFSARYFPAAALAPSIDAATAAAHAALIAGRYQGSRRPETSFVSLLYMLSQTVVSANVDGTISVSAATSPSGMALKWREIAPLVWREDASRELLSARLVDGRITRFSFGENTPIQMFDRVPWSKSAAWWLPVLSLSLLALLMNGVAWPIGALTRRHYGVPAPLSGRDGRAQRWVRLASLASAALFLAWVTVAVTMTSVLDMIAKLDGLTVWLRVLSLCVFPIGAAVGLWHAAVVLQSLRRWYAKLWAVLLATAMAALLWAAFSFHLISFHHGY